MLFFFWNIYSLFYFFLHFFLRRWLNHLTRFKFFIWRCPFFCRLSKSTSFERCVSCKILSAIVSLRFFLDNHVAFISYKLTIRPISSFEFGKYKQSFIADFKSSCSRDLLVVWAGFVIILNEVIVDVIIKILFWDLIFHNHSTWNTINNALSDFLEKLLILGFIVPCVPSVLLAILASFYYEN